MAEAEPSEFVPVVMHPTTMHCSEREKVRRICTPKSTTGRLEVPEDIFKMWNTAGGREKLFSMWCKSGGVKAGPTVSTGLIHDNVRHHRVWNEITLCCEAIFLETVEILCVTTKSKTLEVKGGFYSEEDMATELKYSRPIQEYTHAIVLHSSLLRLYSFLLFLVSL